MTKFKIYTLIFIALMVSSCSEDFIDKQPVDRVVSSNFYQTEQQAFEALISVYDAVGFQSTPGIAWAPVITVSDMLSDDAFAGGADANDGMQADQLNRFQIQPQNVLLHSIWLKNYTGIYRANLFLSIIDGIDASEEFKTRTIAEVKFLRAHFYYELVRFFENIPLVTTVLNNPDDYSVTQAAPQEVYDFIATDLVEAMQGLPEVIPPTEAGRVGKFAASALMARVFLFSSDIYGTNMEASSVTVDRAQALAYVEEIISSGQYSLLSDFDEVFRLASEFSEESIFEIPHGDNPNWFDWGFVRGGEGNLASQMQGPRVTGSDNWNRGWSFAPVSQDLVDAFGNDPRLAATITFEDDLDGNLVKGYQHTGYFSKKYSSDAEHWGDGGQFEHNRTTNQRVIRYSHVLLMAAELGSPNAQAYLDEVRARAGVPSVPVSIDNIHNERRLEFALEGMRYFDLIRRGANNADQELSETGIRGVNYNGDQIIYDVQFNAASNGFMPIPQTELDLSAGVFMQNAGY